MTMGVIKWGNRYSLKILHALIISLMTSVSNSQYLPSPMPDRMEPVV